VTIAESIAQLSPPQSHGDRVAIELLEQQARQVAELDAEIAALPAKSLQRKVLEGVRQWQLNIATAVAQVALAYRLESRDIRNN
jgi:hypothetical protein